MDLMEIANQHCFLINVGMQRIADPVSGVFPDGRAYIRIADGLRQVLRSF
jgi:hypothetical protein